MHITNRRASLVIAAAAICAGAGCSTPQRPEGSPIAVGWVQFAGEVRIYPQRANLGKLYDGSCISGVMVRGVKFPSNLNGKRVAAYGNFVGNAELEAMKLRGESIGAENYCASESVGLFTRIVAAEAPP